MYEYCTAKTAMPVLHSFKQPGRRSHCRLMGGVHLPIARLWYAGVISVTLCYTQTSATGADSKKESHTFSILFIRCVYVCVHMFVSVCVFAYITARNV